MTNSRRWWCYAANNPLWPITLALAVIGLLALASGTSPPDAVEDVTPRWLTIAWAITFLGGGLVAGIAGMTGRGRVEDAGLGFLVFGLVVYAVAEVVTWPIGGNAAALLVALAAACLIRIRMLHQPRENAPPTRHRTG